MKPLRTRPLLRLTPLTLLLLLPVCDRNVTEEPPPDSGPGVCAELPAPPRGQRCTTTPSPSGSKSILLKGTLLLPDSVLKSGQVLVDKSRCWRALALCNWYMQNSNNFFFYHVHGDKEVFHLAWRKLDQPYVMPSRGIDALDGVMCQHDLAGNRVFQHRNMRKWTFYHNPPTPRFTHEDKCLEFLSELKHQWSPAASTPVVVISAGVAARPRRPLDSFAATATR